MHTPKGFGFLAALATMGALFGFGRAGDPVAPQYRRARREAPPLPTRTRTSKYAPHQGARERARNLRRLHAGLP